MDKKGEVAAAAEMQPLTKHISYKSIESYLAKADNYRVAHPGYPQPQPLRMTPLNDPVFTATCSFLRPRIVTILDSHDIKCICVSAEQSDHQGAKKSIKTLLILVDAKTHEYLPAAAEDIYHCFKKEGCDDLQVELRDPQRWKLTANYGGSPSQEHLYSYNSVRMQLLSKVHTALGSRTCGFSLYMCGRYPRDEEPKPTVIILVKPSSTHDNWAKVEGDLKQVLRDGGCQVDLELHRGWIEHASDIEPLR